MKTRRKKIEPVRLPDWEMEKDWSKVDESEARTREIAKEQGKKSRRNRKVRVALKDSISIAIKDYLPFLQPFIKIRGNSMSKKWKDKVKGVQKSTWAGIAGIIGVIGAWFGLDLNPEIMVESIEGIVAGVGMVVVGVASLYEMIRNE